jgi:hypothetical protein
VFAPPHHAPFVFAQRGKIQLNPFASAKLSSSSTDALPSQIVKEQPIRLAKNARRQQRPRRWRLISWLHVPRRSRGAHPLRIPVT